MRVPSAAGGVLDLYWRHMSPLIHCRAGRVVLVTMFTALFIFAAAYLPTGPLWLNAIR